MKDIQNEIKKLHWKSRRGMKELDLLFEHYLYQHYENADDAHRAAFAELAELQDPLITDYLFARATPPSTAINDIIDIMRQFKQQQLES